MADFLDQAFPVEQQAEEPAPQPETPIEQQVEATQPEPAPEAPAPEPAPEVSATEEPKRTVPLPVFLDQRDKLKELERWKAEQEAKARQPVEAPNPYDDPNGFAAWQTQQVQQMIVQDRFERSHETAVERHGEDKVREAIEWATARAQTNPGFAAEYMQNTRPVEWIVQQHQRDALLSDIGDPSKLDDWFAREAAKRGYALQSAPIAATPAPLAPIAAAQPAQKPAQPPRSLAAETGVAPTATHDDARAEFLSIFDKR